jgi:adenylate cyclase
MACSRIHAIVHKPAFRAGSAGNCQPSYLDKLLQPFALFKSIDCLGRVMDALPKYVPEAAIRSLMDGRDMSLQCIDAAVFFLDVENFTGQLAARRSSHPDSLALLHQMSQAFDVFSQQVVAHGGVLDKVVGDSIVCWFPSDAASESHNVRACRAALGCLDAVTRLHETWSRDGYALLQFRIGIASGPCYCGSFGAPQHRVHWTVMSDVVNTASRLESLAKQFRARVVVSKEIVDDVRAACMSDARDDALGRVQFELLGKEVLRGRSTETDVYSLTAVPQFVVDDDSCSVSQSSA